MAKYQEHYVPLASPAVPAYLQAFGYEATTDSAWLVAPEPVLELGVPGHEEIDGHTFYFLDCSLKLPEALGGQQLSWRAGKRLKHLKEHVHDVVKELLGDAYRRHFGEAPFASKGGLPGTTSRLHLWFTALASAVNTGVASPAVAALALHFFEAPEPECGLDFEDTSLQGAAASAPEDEEDLDSRVVRPEVANLTMNGEAFSLDFGEDLGDHSRGALEGDDVEKEDLRLSEGL